MINENFNNEEFKLLKKYNYDVKNNLQDAYRTYTSPSLIDYKVHISLTEVREYFVKQIGQSLQEEPGGSFKSLSILLETLEQRLMSVSM